MNEQRDGDDGRLEELSALYRISTLSAFSGDTEAAVGEILRVISELVSCGRPVLFLFSEPFQEMRLETLGEDNGLKIPLREAGLVRRVFVGGSSELTNDIGTDPEGFRLAEILKARQIAAAPLAIGGRVLGVLAAVDSERGAFTEGDLRLVTILGDRAALTIENSQLLSQLGRQVQELESLQRLSRLLTSADSLESVVGESMRIVTDSVPCEKSAVLLYDEATDSLVAHKPVLGVTDEQADAFVIPMSEPSLAGMVFRTNTALTSNDAQHDAWVSPRVRDLLDMSSFLAVPLASGPRPIGVLASVNATAGVFSEEDERFLSLLGSQVGSVIEAIGARERERGLIMQLREVDRTRSEFISMLAHELRGPMTTIMGFGYTLRDQGHKLDEEKRNHIVATVVRET
ncbi:MAG TPA: GAF domain-containing protein, partial [Actinomycetota bacterium]|nr:GAF domain-containing protein [Actinomycetota bacterium]